MTVNVLGTKYKVMSDDSLPDYADGVCKIYGKEIHISTPEKMLDDYETLGEKKERYKEVMRHEIIHAFFHEAGLKDTEDLVYWLAREFPNMVKAFESVGCLGVEE